MLGLSTNPIPIKAAMELLGRDTGELRMPLTPLDARRTGEASHDARQIRAVVESPVAAAALAPGMRAGPQRCLQNEKCKM